MKLRTGFVSNSSSSSFIIVDGRDKELQKEDVEINISFKIKLKDFKNIRYNRSYKNFKDFCISVFNFCNTRQLYNLMSSVPSGYTITFAEHKFWEYRKERNKERKQELLDEFIRMIEDSGLGVIPGSMRRVYRYFEEGKRIYWHEVERDGTQYDIYYHGKLITENIHIFKFESF